MYLKEHSDEPRGISATVAYESASFYEQSVRRDKLRQLETKVAGEITPVENDFDRAPVRELLDVVPTTQ